MGFKIGKVYRRQAEVHRPLFGDGGPGTGNTQGGIGYTHSTSVIYFVTGEAGKESNYEDRWRDDGVFEYCGQGKENDHTFTAGNEQIRDHAANGKQLLMFTNVGSGNIRFDGEMVCEGYERRDIEIAENHYRDSIIFNFRPIDAINEHLNSEQQPMPDVDLETLRNRAFAAVSIPAENAGRHPRNVYQRSEDIRDYVLARAKGRCEGGQHKANFSREDGRPYLEPHHIRRVSDGGLDDPRFVIALCETCHRKVHHGQGGSGLNQKYLSMMLTIERGPD